MSSSTSTIDRGHPITVAAAEIHALLDQVAAQVAELELRVAAHAETNRVGDASGATSAAAWWAHATKQTKGAAHRKVRLAKALDTDEHQPVREALAAGRVLVDQAAVIVAAVDALPDDAEDWVKPKAQQWLLDQAEIHDARALRMLGKRIYQVVDPEAADEYEAEQLEREEQEAEAAAMFRMHDDGHGRTDGRFSVPTAYAAKLWKAIQAFMSARHLTGVGKDPQLDAPTPHRAGLAFMDLIDRLPIDQIPKAGGMSASVVATIDYEVLFGKLQKAGLLDTGDRISPAASRRLACLHGVIPAVMGGKSKVLDLGAKRRFYTGDQRLVFTVEQGGCTTEGCDMPAWVCEAHHPQPWSEGGETNRDGIWLCPYHHRRAHDSRYEMTHLPSGKVSFHRRT